jgi:hypothetical protein
MFQEDLWNILTVNRCLTSGAEEQIHHASVFSRLEQWHLSPQNNYIKFSLMLK